MQSWPLIGDVESWLKVAMKNVVDLLSSVLDDMSAALLMLASRYGHLSPGENEQLLLSSFL